MQHFGFVGQNGSNHIISSTNEGIWIHINKKIIIM